MDDEARGEAGPMEAGAAVGDAGGEHVLRDGTRVRIRPLRPEDARTLQDGFARLSPESRRRRSKMRAPRTRLSDDEVRFLTEGNVAGDGEHATLGERGGPRRLALGAVRIDGDGWECEGLGLARYVCLRDHPEVAEPSVTVVDAARGLGLGRLLSEHLVRTAAANGVKTFRALLVDEHAWLRDRIRRSYPDARLTRRGQHLGADFPLPALAPRDAEAADAREHDEYEGDGRFWSLLRWVAQGSVRPDRPGPLRRAVARLARRER
jgi:GNAT superfamily N-acetyltransferase